MKPGVFLRVKALFLDWLFICAYLLVLFAVVMAVYFLVLDGIPAFTHLQSQWLAALSSMVPMVIVFSVMEGARPFGSWGKRKTNLRVAYKDGPMKRSVVRNTLKFLPWQLGHMSTINGIYNGFDTPVSITFLALSLLITIIYVVMAFSRKDNRHLADVISGSRVILRA